MADEKKNKVYRDFIAKARAKVKDEYGDEEFDDDLGEFIIDTDRQELPLTILTPFKDSVIRFYSDMDTKSFLKVKTRVNNNIKYFYNMNSMGLTMGAMAYFDSQEHSVVIDSEFIYLDDKGYVVVNCDDKKLQGILQHEIHHSAGTRVSVAPNDTSKVSIGLITNNGRGYVNVGEGVNDYFTQLSTGFGNMSEKTGYTIFSTVASILRHSTDLMTLKNAHVNDFGILNEACKKLSGSDLTLANIEYNLEWQRCFESLAIGEASKAEMGQRFSQKKINMYENMSADALYNVFDEAYFKLLLPKLSQCTQNERVDIINSIFREMDEDMINVGFAELLEVLSFDQDSYTNVINNHKGNLFKTGLDAGREKLVILDKNGNPLKYAENIQNYRPISEDGYEDKLTGFVALSTFKQGEIDRFMKEVEKSAPTGEVKYDSSFRSNFNKKLTQCAIREVANKMGYMVGEFSKQKKTSYMVAPITKDEPRPELNEEERIELATFISEKVNEFDENQSIIRMEENKQLLREAEEETLAQVEESLKEQSEDDKNLMNDIQSESEDETIDDIDNLDEEQCNIDGQIDEDFDDFESSDFDLTTE